VTTPSAIPAGDIALISQRDRGDLESALAVLRGRIDEEFQRAERIDRKARGAFALAAGFFAGAQAAALASFGASSVTSAERFMILAATIAAGSSLLVVALRLQQCEELKGEQDVPPKTIREWCRDQTEPRSVTARLIWTLSEVARCRSASNGIRAELCERVISAAQLSAILCGVELALALVARI
jgi:hypothetical protein